MTKTNMGVGASLGGLYQPDNGYSALVGSVQVGVLAQPFKEGPFAKFGLGVRLDIGIQEQVFGGSACEAGGGTRVGNVDDNTDPSTECISQAGNKAEMENAEKAYRQTSTDIFALIRPVVSHKIDSANYIILYPGGVDVLWNTDGLGKDRILIPAGLGWSIMENPEGFLMSMDGLGFFDPSNSALSIGALLSIGYTWSR